MKTRLLITAMLFLFAGMAQAQLTPAKPIPPDILRNATIKAPAQVIWDLIVKLDNVEDYSNGYVVSSEKLGDGEGATRILEFQNGEKRTEEALYVAPKIHKIGFKIPESPLPVSFHRYYFEIESTGSSKSRITLKGYYTLEDKSKKKEVNKYFANEFDHILKGLKSYFEE